MCSSDLAVVAFCNGDASKPAFVYGGKLKSAGLEAWLFNFAGGRKCAGALTIDALMIGVAAPGSRGGTDGPSEIGRTAGGVARTLVR